MKDANIIKLMAKADVAVNLVAGFLQGERSIKEERQSGAKILVGLRVIEKKLRELTHKKVYDSQF